MSLLASLSKFNDNFLVVLASGSLRRKEMLMELFPNLIVCPSKAEDDLTPSVLQNLKDLGAAQYVRELAILKARDTIGKVDRIIDEVDHSMATIKDHQMGKKRDQEYILILGADTSIRSPDGPEMLDKPGIPEVAKKHLKNLSGKSHCVYTGVCMLILRNLDAGDKILANEDGASSTKNGNVANASHGSLAISGVANGSVTKVIKEISFVAHSEVVFRELSDDTIDAYVETGEPLDKAGSYGIQGLGGLLVKEIKGCHRNVIGLPLSEICERLANEVKELRIIV